MTAETVHRFIAECSISYLSGLGGGEVLSRPVFGEFPLLEYCAVNWMKHYEKGEKDSKIVAILARFFDVTKPAAYLNWLNSYNPDYDAPGESFPLHSDMKKNIETVIEPLYWSAQLGDAKLVEILINKGAGVNGSGKGCFGSPLGVAGYYGYQEVVRKLLDCGANPDGRGGRFGSVLQAAAAGGPKEIVEMLVKAGADIEKTGALAAAATRGHDEIVSFLLKHISARSAKYGSALFDAARAGNRKAAVTILEAGADINEVGPYGTPLCAAAESGSLELVQTLIDRGADVNKGGRGEWGHPLIAAAQRGNPAVVHLLIRMGADVNVPIIPWGWFGSGGQSVLEAAVKSGDLPTFQAILDAGGDPHIQGDYYPNCLFAALYRKQFEMARILLDNNAEITDGGFIQAIKIWRNDQWSLRMILEKNPNIDAHEGREGSALHIAIDEADEEAAQLILTKKPYINALSRGGTPLSCAIRKGMNSLAKELIKQGANVHKTISGAGHSPLTAALEFQACSQTPDYEMADLLIELGVSINSDERAGIYHAIKEGNISAIQYLGKHGADLDSILEIPGVYPRANCTPLHYAARKGNQDVIETLLNLGVNVNGPPGEEGTIVHYAILSKSEEIVEYLLSRGAIVDDTISRRSIICNALSSGLSRIVPKLIKLGADVDKEGYKGVTPLSLAIERQDKDLEKLLRKHGATAVDASTLIRIIERNDIETLEQLLKNGVDPNIREDGDDAMTAAVETESKDIVKLLFDYGYNPDYSKSNSWPPLMTAISNYDYNMAEYLLERGVGPKECEALVEALKEATRRGDIKMIELLLSYGTDLMGLNGRAFQAAVHGGERILLHLLSKVAPQYRISALDAALQEAAKSANLDICRILVDLGADVGFVGGKYGSPLHAVVSSNSWCEVAEANNRKSIFSLFLEKGAEPREVEGFNSLLTLALGYKDDAYVMALLKAGADPNGRGSNNLKSPLQAAARYKPSLLELLIEAGADVNAIVGDFGTALHVAAWAHDCQGISILLKYGAKVDVLSPKYGGVIQTAAECNTVVYDIFSSEARSVRAMQLLQSHGASVHTKGGEQGNALQVAASLGNLPAVKWLLEQGVDPFEKGLRGTALEAAWENEQWNVVSYLEQHYGQISPDCTIKPVA